MSSSRIPTPLAQHWHRFRLGCMPFLCFVGCLAFTLWLWQRQAFQGTIVGEVTASQYAITAGIDGSLVLPEGRYWQAFDEVQQGQVLAILDERPAQARLRELIFETERLDSMLAAARTEYELDIINLTQGHEREKRNLLWEFERRRLEQIRLEALINIDRAQLDRVNASLDILNSLNQGKDPDGKPKYLVSRLRVTELEEESKVTLRRIYENERVLDDVIQQAVAAQTRLRTMPELFLPELDTLLSPIRAQMRVAQAQIEQINLELEKLIIQSPIDGVITEVFKLPEQPVLAADPILTVATRESRYIVSYVREQQRLRPRVGMEVSLRLREPGSPEYRTSIETVGPQVVPVPPHQLKDQATPEWAFPVQMSIPPDLDAAVDLKPGELLQVIFNRD